jgi:quercetin dioxygenase-like cupin family protein
MKVMDFIPQVFYDVIARITPGLLLLISILSVFAKPLSEAWIQYKILFLQTPATTTLITIIFAYVLSILVEGIHNDTKRIREKLNKMQKRPNGRDQRNEVWREAWRDFCTAHPSREGMKPPQPADAVAIDAIRLFNPAVGSRIVKLRAEVALCRTLSCGWMGLLILYVFYIVGSIATKRELSSITVVFTVFLLLLGIRAISSRLITIDGRHIRALYNHWLLLVNPGPPDETEKKLEYVDVKYKGPPVFIIPFRSLKKDAQLMKDKDGARKLLVTEIWDSIEELATECYWLTPDEKYKNQVLRTANVEMAVFSHYATQDRHFHKLGTEIYSVLEGKMDIEINETTHTLERGDTIVVRPGTIHQVIKNKPFLCQVVSANCHGQSDKFIIKEKNIKNQK